MAGTPVAYGQTRQEAAREWHGNGGETVRNGMSNRPSFRIAAPRGAACGLDVRFPTNKSTGDGPTISTAR